MTTLEARISGDYSYVEYTDRPIGRYAHGSQYPINSHQYPMFPWAWIHAPLRIQPV